LACSSNVLVYDDQFINIINRGLYENWNRWQQLRADDKQIGERIDRREGPKSSEVAGLILTPPGKNIPVRTEN